MDKSIIICEGKTDAILLSYYLEAVRGWQSIYTLKKDERKLYEKSIKNGSDFKVKDANTQEINWYVRDQELLCIRAAGSIDIISDVFKEIIEFNGLGDDEYFKKIAVIADRDEGSSETKLISNLSEEINYILEHNIWENIGGFKDKFGLDRKFSVFALLLPLEEEGALEKFLLNALSDIDKTDRKVIYQSNTFIDNLDCCIEETGEKKYLQGRGDILKAKFATFFAISTPRRTFDSGDKIIRSVKWEHFSYVNESFKKLAEGL